MTDWTSGYVSDVGYTFGYYPELQPHRLRLAFIERGLAMPQVRNACELGFGQGMSVNIHAAASDVRWWGTDFNPAQARFAQELAAVSGAGAQLFDQSFEEFCARTDLPEFDYIGLHGLWSWISDDNRRCIVDFLRRKLRPGGVAYISYNVLPGWAQMVPVRHLLTRHADTLSAPGDALVQRIDRALDFADAMMQLKPAFARSYPQAGERLAQMRKHNRNYLAHEYFNRDWHPMHFLDMADWMHGAKAEFACSAHYFDHVDPVNFTPEQQAFMKDVPDRLFREEVRDFMLNTQFRRDVWAKGLQTLSQPDRLQDVRAVRLLLVTPRGRVTLKAGTPLGEAALNSEVYEPVLDALARQVPVSVGQLEKAVAGRNVTFGQLVQAVLILVGKGDVQQVQGDAVIEHARPQCDRLNRHVMDLARNGGDVGTLASPVTGAGFSVQRFEQLFLRARQDGAGTPQEMALVVHQLLKERGQRIVTDGKVLETDEAGTAHMLELARKFDAETLPTLRALQIA